MYIFIHLGIKLNKKKIRAPVKAQPHIRNGLTGPNNISGKTRKSHLSKQKRKQVFFFFCKGNYNYQPNPHLLIKITKHLVINHGLEKEATFGNTKCSLNFATRTSSEVIHHWHRDELWSLGFHESLNF